MSDPLSIALVRSAGDRRLYELDGVGSLRLNGWLMRSATVRTADATFTVRKARWNATVVAVDAAGTQIGLHRPHALRGGGTLTWHGVEHELRHDALLAERYALVDHGRLLAEVTAKGWWGWGSRKPVELTVHERTDPGLLLFAAFVVRTRSSDAAAVSAATTSSTGAYSG